MFAHTITFMLAIKNTQGIDNILCDGYIPDYKNTLRRSAMKGVELVKPNFTKEIQAEEWLVSLLSRKTQLQERKIKEAFNASGKLRTVAERLPFEKAAHSYGYIILEQGVDFLFPTLSQQILAGMSKYWNGSEVNAEQKQEILKAVDMHYKNFLGEFPYFERSMLGFSLIKDRKVDEDISTYFKVFATQSYSVNFVSSKAQLLVNYLTMPTKSIARFPMTEIAPPVALSCVSALVASVYLWLIWPEGFEKYFGLLSPFHFENIDEIFAGFEEIRKQVEIGQETEDKPFEKVAMDLYYKIKQDTDGVFLRQMFTYYQYIALPATYLATNIWLNKNNAGRSVSEIVTKHKENVSRRIKQMLYSDGIWDAILKFGKKFLNIEPGRSELTLIEDALNAVKLNTYGLLKNALGRYAKARSGVSVDARPTVVGLKKRDSIRYYLQEATLEEFLNEVERVKDNLSDYQSLRCFFGVDDGLPIKEALHNGVIPEEWRTKTVMDIIEIVANTFDFMKYSNRIEKIYGLSYSYRPLSYNNLESIMMSLLKYYRMFGREKLLAKLVNLFDTIYGVGYSYRGLRAFGFLLLVALIAYNPELVTRIKCVGRKFSRKYVSLFNTYLS